MKIEKHLYDPASLQVSTFNGRGKDSTIFDVRTGKIIRTIPLGANRNLPPPTAMARFTSTLQDTNEVAELDSLKASGKG